MHDLAGRDQVVALDDHVGNHHPLLTLLRQASMRVWAGQGGSRPEDGKGDCQHRRSSPAHRYNKLDFRPLAMDGPLWTGKQFLRGSNQQEGGRGCLNPSAVKDESFSLHSSLSLEFQIGAV